MQCHLCGKESFLSASVIEGIEMQVCSECSTLGTKPRTVTKKTVYFEDSEEYIVENFSMLIRNARENKNLKMQNAAKQLALKESLLHKFETGSITPNIDEAKKLERFYGLKLVSQERTGNQVNITGDAKNYTFADTINQQS